MGKEGDLWDDSALINAFDSAMCKYKKMHKIESDASAGEGKDISRNEDNVPFLVEETISNKSIRESQENNKALSSAEMEIPEANCLSQDKENPSQNLQGLETHVDSYNGMADAPKGDSYVDGTDDYNQLLKQYYEIEEKRQTVLQQLNQFGGWDYQYSGEGSGSAAQWGTCSASQDYTAPICQVSHPTTVCSCCCYVSQCTVSPCPLLGGTSGCQICADHSAARGTGNATVEDDGMVKTAMEAAEKAISSIRMKNKVDSHVNQAVKENGGELAQSTSSSTDLNDVLKAWYSAGFYTGKYLVEQSIAKKSHS